MLSRYNENTILILILCNLFSEQINLINCTAFYMETKTFNVLIKTQKIPVLLKQNILYSFNILMIHLTN